MRIARDRDAGHEIAFSLEALLDLPDIEPEQLQTWTYERAALAAQLGLAPTGSQRPIRLPDQSPSPEDQALSVG